MIEGSHSLHPYPVQRLPLAYRRARRDTADYTGLPLPIVPQVSPWSIEQVLDEDFWPVA